MTHTKIRLKSGSNITVSLDSGAKINVMIKKLIKDINLAIKQRFKLELISYISYN